MTSAGPSLLLAATAAALCLLVGSVCGALKIQSPTDDLPKELNHPRHVEDLQKAYLNLETVLSKIYEVDNFPLNLELVNGMLESERRNPTLLKGVKNLNKTIDLFMSMKSVYNKCDYESYKSLAQNYRAVDGRSHELYEKRRALEMMIYDYALEHARECVPQYVQQFEEISQRPATKIVSQIVDRVLKGLDADSLLAGENGSHATRYRRESVIETGVAGLDLSNYGFLTIVKNIETLVQGKSEADFFYPALNKLKPTLPRGFEANIFDRYLIVPCQQYNELLRDVFAPARFDAMIKDENEVDQVFPSTSNERFNIGWIQYRACKHLAGWADRKDILSVVKQVVKSLTRRPE